MVFFDTIGDSLKLPVSVHGKSSRSEYSSEALVVRVSAYESSGTTATSPDT
jgi:hypothetical protein